LEASTAITVFRLGASSISPLQQVEMLNEINKKVKKGNHLDKHSDDEGLAVHYQIPNLHQ
jgi:hypothetical protein